MAILQSGYTDASRTNASSRSTRLYRDIALSFETNAATKDVIVKKDVDAVKQSVKNLILTKKIYLINYFYILIYVPKILKRT